MLGKQGRLNAGRFGTIQYGTKASVGCIFVRSGRVGIDVSPGRDGAVCWSIV